VLFDISEKKYKINLLLADLFCKWYPRVNLIDIFLYVMVYPVSS